MAKTMICEGFTACARASGKGIEQTCKMRPKSIPKSMTNRCGNNPKGDPQMMNHSEKCMPSIDAVNYAQFYYTFIFCKNGKNH